MHYVTTVQNYSMLITTNFCANLYIYMKITAKFKCVEFYTWHFFQIQSNYRLNEK